MGSAEDDLGELHADIALADTWVAESVVTYLKRGTFLPAKIDVLHELKALHIRAIALGNAGGAAEYLQYIDLLSNLYEAFLREGDQTGPA
jgi:hypothetical protein